MAAVETSTPIAGPSVINLDLVQLNAIIAGVVSAVVRQVMVIGDAETANAFLDIQQPLPTGVEMAAMVALKSGSDITNVTAELSLIRAELQNLAGLLGGMPATPAVNP